MDHAHPDTDPDGLVGLRYWPPAAELGKYFGAIYLFTSKRGEYQDLTRADVSQLRFMIRGGGYYRFHDGAEQQTPEVTLIGPTMGATRFFLNRPATVLGVSVLPLGWLALGHGPANEHANRLKNLGDQDRYTKMLGHLRGHVDPELAVQALWEFLAEVVVPVPDEAHALVTVIDRWLSTDSSPQIDDLVRLTGLSARQIARHTNRLYGGSPKLLARKYRALRCASQIVIDRKGWQELCDDGNFYDQAHFIREIKQFLGVTPHRLLNDPTEVAKLTVQRRALTGLMSELQRLS